MTNDELSQRLRDCVEAYDMLGLDALAKLTCDSEQRQLLANDGYLALASYLEYDIACSKAPAGATDDVIGLIESAEQLLSEALWFTKGASHTLAAETAPDASEAMRSNAEKAIACFERELAERGAQANPLTLSALANAHLMLAKLDAPNHLAHWPHALRLVEAITATPKDNARVHLVLSVLFEPIAFESVALRAQREAAGQAFMQRLNERPPTYLDVTMAKAASELSAHVNRAPFLERAKRWAARLPPDATPDQVRTAGHFFAQQQQLVEAEQLYRELLARTPSPGLELTYLAEVLERSGQIDQAWSVYEAHASSFERHFSTMSHYIEFLERLLDRDAGKRKPSLELVRTLAESTARMGQGHYGGPHFLLARVALRGGDEHAALNAVYRSLVSLELLVEDRLVDLQKWVIARGLTAPRLTTLIAETLSLFSAVKVGYVYDGGLKGEALFALSTDEVIARWNERARMLCHR